MTSNAVSAREKPISSAVAIAISVLPACLRTTPLGRPVVPDVYISAQTSVPFTGSNKCSAGAELINSS